MELNSKEVGVTMLIEENRIMMADLTVMDPETRAWILKKEKVIKDRNA